MKEFRKPLGHEITKKLTGAGRVLAFLQRDLRGIKRELVYLRVLYSFQSLAHDCKASRGWMAMQRCRKMDQQASGFRSAKPYQGTTKERICIIVLLANAIFPPQNALPDNAKERPRNAKERFALKLCPLSGKTAFLGIALWKDRIFKGKNPRPRNARSPPQGPHPGPSLAHIVTHPPFFNPPDVSRRRLRTQRCTLHQF